MGMEDFDRYFAVQARVVSEEHLAHATAPKRCLNLVGTKTKVIVFAQSAHIIDSHPQFGVGLRASVSRRRTVNISTDPVRSVADLSCFLSASKCFGVEMSRRGIE
jgi:hypothetical protein